MLILKKNQMTKFLKKIPCMQSVTLLLMLKKASGKLEQFI